MSRIYTVTFSGTITNANGDVDLVEIAPAAEKPCRLVGYVIGQTSEIKEAEEEGIKIDVIRLPATFTSGNGTAATEEPLDPHDPTAGFASETLGATVATTSGTASTLDSRSWNNRNSPFEAWWPDPEMRPKAINGQGLVIRWQTTVADDVTVSGTAYVEEV